jgi:hypothetical protein
MRYLVTVETTQRVDSGPTVALEPTKTYTLPYHHRAKERHAVAYAGLSGYWVPRPDSPTKIEHGESGVMRFFHEWQARDGSKVLDERVVTFKALDPGDPLRGMKPIRGRNGV